MSPIDWAAWHDAYDAPRDDRWTVGSHRHAGEPPPLQPGVRLWTACRS